MIALILHAAVTTTEPGFSAYVGPMQIAVASLAVVATSILVIFVVQRFPSRRGPRRDRQY